MLLPPSFRSRTTERRTLTPPWQKRRLANYVGREERHNRVVELRTPLCDMLGIDYPIFSVGFGLGAPPELAAAVSNAGGCGVLGTGEMASHYVGPQIRRLRQLTTRPFGANMLIAGQEVHDLRPALTASIALTIQD